VHDGGARLVVLGLGDPHLLEGGQGCQDGATDPDGVLSLRRSNNLDLHGRRSQGGQFLGHALSNAREHGGTTGQHDVGVQVAADIHVALHDGLESAVVHTRGLLADKGRLEEDLRASESLSTDDDDVAVGKLVGLLQSRGLGGGLGLLVEVQGDVGELLLDVSYDFSLGSGGEGVATLGQDLHQVVGQVAAGKVKTHDGVGKSVAFVDGDSVGDTITRVQNAAGGSAGGVQRQHGLDVHVHGGHVEGLEHDLGHALSVGLGVQGGLSQQDGVLLRGNTQLVVEGVVPDLLHIVPVGHDAVLNGVLQSQHTSLGLGLVSDVSILLVHADHDSGVLGSANNGGEDGSWGVITSKAGLAHTGTVINNKGLHVFVGHLYFLNCLGGEIRTE
jgi:hypothetical protein